MPFPEVSNKVEQQYAIFMRHFGGVPRIYDSYIRQDGDVVSVRAPSIVSQGKVKTQVHPTTVVKRQVEMTIPDLDSLLSMEDLEEYYLKPAAEYFQGIVGDKATCFSAKVDRSHLHVYEHADDGNPIRIIERYEAGVGTHITFCVLTVG